MIIVYIILTVLLCAALGTYSGSINTKKWPRRYLIPLTLALHSSLSLSPWCMTLMAIALAYSMGYGIPDDNDDGSTMAAFWYGAMNVPIMWLDFAVRGSIGFIVALACISIPIVTGNWGTYFIFSFLIILTYIAFGDWIDNEWVLVTENYTFLSEDFFVYGLTALAVMGMVYV